MAVDFDLGQMQVSGSSGIDALFEREPQLVTASVPKRIRVASLQQLAGLQRVSAETLVHKSNRDLWAAPGWHPGRALWPQPAK